MWQISGNGIFRACRMLQVGSFFYRRYWRFCENTGFFNSIFFDWAPLLSRVSYRFLAICFVSNDKCFRVRLVETDRSFSHGRNIIHTVTSDSVIPKVFFVSAADGVSFLSCILVYLLNVKSLKSTKRSMEDHITVRENSL